MNNQRYYIKLALFLTVLFAAFWLWQAPGIITGKLSAAEIDHYLTAADHQLNMPEADKKRIIAKVRAWAEADDGKPFYMLNLMRLHEQLNRFPGAPDFQGTPKESNQFYEDHTMPMLIKNAGSAIYGSDIHDKALITINDDKAGDNWTRMLVVRYPNRRAFLQLVGSPDYAKIDAFKFMAQEILLVPTAGDLVVPDPRAIVGALLIIVFLLTGWIRTHRSSKRHQQ